MTQAFLPLLQKSDTPVIVSVSSRLGSFARVMDPEKLESTVNDLIYTSSKSAVTMLTVQYAKSLPGFRINAVDPGPTATDLNGHRGYQTVKEGTDVIVQLATIDKTGPTDKRTQARLRNPPNYRNNRFVNVIPLQPECPCVINYLFFGNSLAGSLLIAGLPHHWIWYP